MNMIIKFKEIYEGDIVECTIHEGSTWECRIRGVVKFKNGAFVVETKTGYSIISDVSDIKVIGNIHDNPELLER